MRGNGVKPPPDGQFVVYQCDFPKCGEALFTISHKCDPMCVIKHVGDSDKGDGMLYIKG
jgi:hypothetical protein